MMSMMMVGFGMELWWLCEFLLIFDLLFVVVFLDLSVLSFMVLLLWVECVVMSFLSCVMICLVEVGLLLIGCMLSIVCVD